MVRGIWSPWASGASSGPEFLLSLGRLPHSTQVPPFPSLFSYPGSPAGLQAFATRSLHPRIPLSGSAYTYAYATLGELIAWIIGWDLVLEYLFAASTVAVGWSGYAVSFLGDLGITVPSTLAGPPLIHTAVEGWQSTGAILNLPAVMIVLVLTILLVLGIQGLVRFNNTIVLVKVSVIMLFICFGVFYIRAENWVTFIPKNTGTFGQFGFSGILRESGSRRFSLAMN